MGKTLSHFLKWCVGLEAATTQTTDAERASLVKHATGRRRVAEIGVWEGVTARLLRAATATDGLYIGIDPYPVGSLGFSTQKVIAQTIVGRVKGAPVAWIRKTGGEAAADPIVTTSPIDFLFIDGDHSYEGIRGDWEAWAGRIAHGGIVALHDSHSTPTRDLTTAGSLRYTNEVILQDDRFDLVEVVDSLTVLKRQS
jgi:predicted O-methyltransferase YrrM